MSRQRLRLGVLALAALVLSGPAVAPTAAVTSRPVTAGIHGQAVLAGPSADEDPGYLKRRQKAQAEGLIDADGRVPGSQSEEAAPGRSTTRDTASSPGTWSSSG